MNYSKLTNEELLNQYRDLDSGAFDEFFRRNSGILFQFIASRLRNQSEAEDVLQETFFRIHKYILKYDPSQSAMGWTFTIAKNCILDRIAMRKKQLELENELPSHLASEARELEFQGAAEQHLATLLQKLPDEERKLLEDRFLSEASYEKLATEHGISPAGVRQRISRVIRKLREFA